MNNTGKEIENLIFKPLTEDNIRDVYQMCEKNVFFLSQSFETFQRASIGSKSFESDLSIVASDVNGNVIAFFMAILRRSNILRKKRKVVVLKFFVVEKSWRNIGLGSKLFRLIHEKIKSSTNKCWFMKFNVMTAQPDYWLPGLDPRHTEAYFFLKKHGFKKGVERNNLCVDLSNIPSNEPASRINGYKILRASYENREELVSLKFMPKAYQLSFWPEEIELTFQNNPITSFIVKDSNDKILGWASHSAQFPGSFGPTGVKRSERGNGLGKILLKWCLWDIKQMGLAQAKILWVVGDTVKFYSKTTTARICEFYWTMKRRV
ncbi:MAG: GNAT family N-acetyltransferase [Promethearchaeota archaeon]